VQVFNLLSVADEASFRRVNQTQRLIRFERARSSPPFQPASGLLNYVACSTDLLFSHEVCLQKQLCFLRRSLTSRLFSSQLTDIGR